MIINNILCPFLLILALSYKMIYVFFQSLLVVLIWHKHVLYSHKLGFVNVDLKSIVVKTVETLRTENKKLRDENGALIRVISKLSR